MCVFLGTDQKPVQDHLNGRVCMCVRVCVSRDPDQALLASLFKITYIRVFVCVFFSKGTDRECLFVSFSKWRVLECVQQVFANKPKILRKFIESLRKAVNRKS